MSPVAASCDRATAEGDSGRRRRRQVSRREAAVRRVAMALAGSLLVSVGVAAQPGPHDYDAGRVAGQRQRGPFASSASVAIGTDGLPILSYVEQQGLKVIKCGNGACTGANTVTTVDRYTVTNNWIPRQSVDRDWSGRAPHHQLRRRRGTAEGGQVRQRRLHRDQHDRDAGARGRLRHVNGDRGRRTAGHKFPRSGRVVSGRAEGGQVRQRRLHCQHNHDRRSSPPNVDFPAHDVGHSSSNRNRGRWLAESSSTRTSTSR